MGLLLALPRKFLNFCRKDPAERERAIRSRLLQTCVRLFGSKFFRRGHTFLAFHPDSFVYSPAHREFDELFSRFTSHNDLNNGGDTARLWSLILNVKQVLEEKVPGEFAELGVWRGNTAALLAHYARIGRRQVFLFDTFEGFHEKDIAGIDAKEQAKHFSDTSLDLVRGVMGGDLSHCHYIKGYFPESINAEASVQKYAVVSLDCDLYKPMKAGLEFFYSRMNRGGILFLHDYSSPFWDGAKKAVDEFCAATGEFAVLLPDKSGSAVIRKTKA